MYIRSIKSHKGSNKKRKFSLDGLILRMKDTIKTKQRTLAPLSIRYITLLKSTVWDVSYLFICFTIILG